MWNPRPPPYLGIIPKKQFFYYFPKEKDWKWLGFNLFRVPEKPNNENRTGITKKAQLRKEKEDKKKQKIV